MKATKKFVPTKKLRRKDSHDPYPWESLTGDALHQYAATAAARAWERQQTAARDTPTAVQHDGHQFSPETKSDELVTRRRDAASVGSRLPTGITAWGESVFGEVGGTTAILTNHDRATKTPPVIPTKFVKGPGVIDTIVKVLTEEATKAKPMTKDRLLQRLVELIPGRDKDKMAGTIKTQLTKSGLPARDVPLRTDGKGGFWIFRKK